MQEACIYKKANRANLGVVTILRDLFNSSELEILVQQSRSGKSAVFGTLEVTPKSPWDFEILPRLNAFLQKSVYVLSITDNF